MGAFEFRPAVAADSEEMAALRVSMLGEEEPLSPEAACAIRKNTEAYLARSLTDGSAAYFIAECGGIVAMAGICFFLLPPNDYAPGGLTGYLGSVYTDPAFRGCGLATRLTQMALDEAVARGCQRVWLHATDKGRPIYEKLGFQHSDDLMVKFPGRGD